MNSEVGVALSEGTLLADRYRVGEVLGSGGFGITYSGHDVQLARKVAIKEYFPSNLSVRAQDARSVSIFTGDSKAAYDKGLESFENEAKRLAMLSDHPGIVDVFETVTANNTCYIIMEYLEGQTLKQLLSRRERLVYPDALTLIVPILDAIEAVHALGIIHRDIAPDNIIVSGNGRAYLIDFGAARFSAGAASRSLTVVVKQGYAPEEQYRARGEQGPWTDVYAVAATFYRMVTGVVPVEPPDRMKQDPLRMPSAFGIDAPEGFDQVIFDAMALNASNRIQSVAEFKAALIDPRTYKPRSHDREMLRADRRVSRAVVATGVAVAAVAIIGAGIFLISSQGNQNSTINDPTSQAQNIEMVSSWEGSTDSSDITAGDVITLGKYGGIDIEWQVLDVREQDALLIAEDIIDLRAYSAYPTFSDPIDWERSELRRWLNEEFYISAFEEMESMRIVGASILNYSEDGSTDGSVIDDKVFVLSGEETMEYFNTDSLRSACINMEESLFEDVAERSAGAELNTPLSLEEISAYNGKSFPWWTREAKRVDGDGHISERVMTHDIACGVRPALWIKLES